VSLEERAVAQLSAGAQANAAEWIAATSGTDSAAGARAFEELLQAPSDLARMNALRVAERAPASTLVLDLCFDANQRLARSAALASGTPSHRSALGLQLVGPTLASLAFHGPGAPGEVAGALNDAIDPFQGSFASGAGLATLHRQLRGDRAGMIRTLQQRVLSGTGPDRIRAIQVAGRLDLAANIELELLALISLSAHVAEQKSMNPADRWVLHAAAAAVSVLADLPSPAAQHAVHRCLRHSDNRVRANALDALARCARRSGVVMASEGPLAAAIVEFKNDEHHRVRASAARAMLLGAARASDARSPAAAIILPFLNDARAPHRVSGLWLAERAAGMDVVRAQSHAANVLATTVAEMIRTDPEPEVKIRPCGRNGWRERPTSGKRARNRAKRSTAGRKRGCGLVCERDFGAQAAEDIRDDARIVIHEQMRGLEGGRRQPPGRHSDRGGVAHADDAVAQPGVGDDGVVARGALEPGKKRRPGAHVDNTRLQSRHFGHARATMRRGEGV
jgi:hypothetical protein